MGAGLLRRRYIARHLDSSPGLAITTASDTCRFDESVTPYSNHKPGIMIDACPRPGLGITLGGKPVELPKLQPSLYLLQTSLLHAAPRDAHTLSPPFPHLDAACFTSLSIPRIISRVCAWSVIQRPIVFSVDPGRMRRGKTPVGLSGISVEAMAGHSLEGPQRAMCPPFRRDDDPSSNSSSAVHCGVPLTHRLAMIYDIGSRTGNPISRRDRS